MSSHSNHAKLSPQDLLPQARRSTKSPLIMSKSDRRLFKGQTQLVRRMLNSRHHG